MLFDHISNGYDIGPFSYGNKWASIELKESLLSLPDNNRDKFTNDFVVVPPKAGESTFGLQMNKITVEFESNFTSQILISKTKGHIKALVSNIDIELEAELATQEGYRKEMAPKINIKKINIDIDKKQTKIEITGGIVPWMLTKIERMLQGFLIDYIMKELKTELETTYLDDLNQLAVKYLQYVYLADNIGFDFSLDQKPTDKKDTFLLDLNGTFMTQDQ